MHSEKILGIENKAETVDTNDKISTDDTPEEVSDDPKDSITTSLDALLEDIMSAKEE